MADRTDLYAEPPALPRRLTDPVPVVLAVGVGWLAAAVVLGVLALAGARPLDVWFATCVVGLGLALLGLGVLALQRAANRRGSKGAQRVT